MFWLKCLIVSSLFISSVIKSGDCLWLHEQNESSSLVKSEILEEKETREVEETQTITVFNDETLEATLDIDQSGDDFDFKGETTTLNEDEAATTFTEGNDEESVTSELQEDLSTSESQEPMFILISSTYEPAKEVKAATNSTEETEEGSSTSNSEEALSTPESEEELSTTTPQYQQLDTYFDDEDSNISSGETDIVSATFQY